MKQPPRTVLPALEALLAKREPRVAQAIRSVVQDVRPCVRVLSERASTKPLRPGLVRRLLGYQGAPPTLGATESKFGGTPYCEDGNEVSGYKFIGQVNFGEVRDALSKEGWPLPEGMPERGLLAVDRVRTLLDCRVRWYPAPVAEKSIACIVPTVAKYEARMRFLGSWSMQGLAWFDAVPQGDDELWDYMNGLDIPGVDEDARDGHKLFGHMNEVMNEYFDGAPSDPSASVRSHRLVWRINYDNPADFAWGTNWIYVVVHERDLAEQRLDRAFVRIANA